MLCVRVFVYLSVSMCVCVGVCMCVCVCVCMLVCMRVFVQRVANVFNKPYIIICKICVRHTNRHMCDEITPPNA